MFQGRDMRRRAVMSKKPKKPKKITCEVCKKPGIHKHRYQYCPICRTVTEYVTPIFGMPWVCINKHPDDGKKCARCGKNLKPKEKISELRSENNVKRFCEDCSAMITRLIVPVVKKAT